MTTSSRKNFVISSKAKLFQDHESIKNYTFFSKTKPLSDDEKDSYQNQIQQVEIDIILLENQIIALEARNKAANQGLIDLKKEGVKQRRLVNKELRLLDAFCDANKNGNLSALKEYFNSLVSLDDPAGADRFLIAFLNSIWCKMSKQIRGIHDQLTKGEFIGINVFKEQKDQIRLVQAYLEQPTLEKLNHISDYADSITKYSTHEDAKVLKGLVANFRREIDTHTPLSAITPRAYTPRLSSGSI